VVSIEWEPLRGMVLLTNGRNIMEQVTLELKTLEGKTVTRTIDISNIQFPSKKICITATDPEIQRTKLLEWIEERGNEQHETELSLVSWYVH